MTRATWGLFIAIVAATPAISYFKYQRPVSAPHDNGQHYAVVDEAVWRHALPNLADLRVYSAGKELPFTVRTMRGSRETEQRMVRVLQPATLGGKTQFLLEMEGVPEYDRITLTLGTKNYVARARVEGQDDSHGKAWANLGTTTIFDLTAERLGHNSTLQIPESTYKFLRVTIDRGAKPSDIQSASAGIERSQAATWRDLPGEPRQSQEGKDTVLTFVVPQNVPIERLTVAIDPAQGNFQRALEIQIERGSTSGLGEISRIHMQRGGGRIDVEQTSVPLSASSHGQLRAVIHNGDDVPLRISGARLQQYERRIYFDSAAGTSPQLYYGDSKLNSPEYDYAKLFQSDANAGKLELGAEAANSAYTGRPDERPWSERHPTVLWGAILAAVAILGGIAVSSLKTAQP
jgi:Protein of unknown function (DUF3999)